MKHLLYILIFFTSSVAFGQNSLVVYDRMLKAIKKSEVFQEFISDEDIEYQNFMVNRFLFSFCEFYDDINYEVDIPKDHCKDYISYFEKGYDKYTDEIVIRKGFKKLSGKGKKTHFVYFSKTVNNYIAVKIFDRKKYFGGVDHLNFLFKVSELGNVQLLFSNIVTMCY